MRPFRWRCTERWLIVAVSIIGMDVAAIHWVITARSAIIWGVGTGPNFAHTTGYEMYDGSTVVVVRNFVTGKITGPTVVRPATPAGLCRVWWPAAVSGSITLLAIVSALTHRGRRFIAEFPLPRMTTRRWMIVVAVIATEGGLVITTLRNSGANPLETPWTPILVYLVGLHVMAFTPAGIAALYRLVRIRRSRHDPGTAMDQL